MDLLKSYESDESSSEEPGKSLSEDSLLRSDLCSVYLVTYSQADITKFPTPGKFRLSSCVRILSIARQRESCSVVLLSGET